MKTACVVLWALGLMGVSALRIVADDVPANAAPKPYYYTQGGRNDPFMKYVGNFDLLKGFLAKYDAASDAKQKQQALLVAKFAAMGLIDDRSTFAQFFTKSHLPPDALAVSQPLFEALKDAKFQEELKALVPDQEEGQAQSAWFEKAGADELRKIYLIYAALPFPTSEQERRYADAWGVSSGTRRTISDR